MQKSAGFPVWPDGEWETVRLIGRGSYGAVYEIRRQLFGSEERAAMKVLSVPQTDGDAEELFSEGYDRESVTETFKDHMKSVVAEYYLMRELNGNTNVVNCDDIKYIQHDDGIGWDIYIRMELLTPLTRALEQKITDEQAIRIGVDICKALQLCSARGIVHRDIKPANVFVSGNGDYKLGDFGIAKVIVRTSGGTKIGTYDYMSPEVYHDEPYGSGTDICSLGLVLYWLLNERRLPFQPIGKVTVTEREEARRRRFRGEVLPPPAHGSEELKRIVLKACAFDPKDRYQSAEEMLWDLERLKDMPEEPAEAAPETEKKKPLPERYIDAAVDEDATVGIFGRGSGSAGEKAAIRKPAERRNPEEQPDPDEVKEETVGIWLKPAGAEPPKAPEKEALTPINDGQKAVPSAVAGDKLHATPQTKTAAAQKPGDDAEERERQMAYQIACRLEDNARTVDDFYAAAFAFETAKLSGYRDSAERARRCRNTAEKLRKGQPAEATPKGLHTAIGTGITAKEAYMSACKLEEVSRTADEFEAAATAFEKVLMYRDSAERARRCRNTAGQLRMTRRVETSYTTEQAYAAACALESASKTADDFYAAAFAFEAAKLCGYLDSAERARQCRNTAEKLRRGGMHAGT